MVRARRQEAVEAMRGSLQSAATKLTSPGRTHYPEGRNKHEVNRIELPTHSSSCSPPPTLLRLGSPSNGNNVNA
jgi:hypothetical protein